MDWILASLLMFTSSVAMYLLLRKNQLRKVPNTINNLSLFAIPAFAFFFYNIFSGTSLSITPYHLLLVFLTALLFAYLGNVLSLKGNLLAPNIGYSLLISKSFVIYTTILAVIWFKSQLSLRSVFAIIIVIAFSALIILSDKVKASHVKGNSWVLYSLGAFFCWGNLILLSKYIYNLGVPNTVFLFYLHIFVTLFIVIELLIKNIRLDSVRSNWVPLFFMGIFSTSFNLFKQIGITIAPNLGYVNAINASSISMVTLLSALFFSDELNLRKMIGVLGVTAGLIILLV